MAFAFVRSSALIAALFVFTAWPLAAALAEPPAGAAQAPPLTLDPDLLKPPAPGFEKPPVGKPQDDTSSKLELPTKFDLGTSQLRLDTDRKAIDTIPRVGIDAADPTVLNPNLPQEKASPLKPDYFGFTLSTPTR